MPCLKRHFVMSTSSLFVVFVILYCRYSVVERSRNRRDLTGHLHDNAGLVLLRALLAEEALEWVGALLWEVSRLHRVGIWEGTGSSPLVGEMGHLRCGCQQPHSSPRSVVQ